MKTPKVILTPDLTHVTDPALVEVLRSFFLLIEELHSSYYDDLRLSSSVLIVNDTTPSVRNGKVFITANTQATVLTDFHDAQDGQIIIIICNDTFTSIADAGNFKLSVAWAPNADDTITLVHRGGIWYEIARATN